VSRTRHEETRAEARRSCVQSSSGISGGLRVLGIRPYHAFQSAR
jgi:hypothetical protein